MTLASNAFTTTTNVNAGTLNLTTNSSLGTSSATASVANGATLSLEGTALAIPNNISLQSGSTLLDNNANGANTINGTIALNGTDNINVSNATNDNLTLDGNISGTNVTLNVGGVGTLVLSGSNNTYTGNTDVNAGTLSLASTGALGGTTTVANNATLDLNFTGALANTNTITLNGNGSGNGALTISGTGTTLNNNISLASNSGIGGTGTGTLGGVISGDFNLNKVDSSTITLSGVNTFGDATHGVNVNGGTLAVGNNAGLGNSTAPTSVANGATLALSGTTLNIANPVTLQSGSTLMDSNANGTNALTGNIGLNGSDSIHVNNSNVTY